jgi:hypothetical protein
MMRRRELVTLLAERRQRLEQLHLWRCFYLNLASGNALGRNNLLPG